jgi:hypothetical protein
MPEKRGALLDYYVVPDGSSRGGDGSLTQPFGSLDEALHGIAARHGGPRPSVRPLVGYDKL